MSSLFRETKSFRYVPSTRGNPALGRIRCICGLITASKRGLLVNHFRSSPQCNIAYNNEREEGTPATQLAGLVNHAVGSNTTATSTPTTPTYAIPPSPQPTESYLELQAMLNGMNDQMIQQLQADLNSGQPHTTTHNSPTAEDDFCMPSDDTPTQSTNWNPSFPTELPNSVIQECFPPEFLTLTSSHIMDIYDAGKHRFHPKTPFSESPSGINSSDISMLYSVKDKPLYLFDDMQKRQAEDRYRIKRDMIERYQIVNVQEQDREMPKAHSRRAVLKAITKLYGMEGVKTRTRLVTLPHTKAKFKVVTFSFAQQILSLLTDPLLMQPDNLLLPPDQPFGPPPGMEQEFIDDIDSGKVFANPLAL